MKNLVCISKNSRETELLGRFLARAALESKARHQPLVIGLIGELGSGKTTFAQGFAKGLGIRNRITSPTFVLMKRFGIPQKGKKKFQHLIHLDLYRLSSKEIRKLKWKELLQDDASPIILMEWAEKATKFLPKNFLMIFFRHLTSSTRLLTFTHS